MFIQVKARGIEFMAATKMRYYHPTLDGFVDVKPGVRLFIAVGRRKWLISNEGFRNLNTCPAYWRRPLKAREGE